MSQSDTQKEEANGPVSTQVAAIDEVGEMKGLKIHPRKVLESLGHLRIDGARITPIESKDSKRGGKADVEAAMLAPGPSSSSSEPGDIQYVAVKKLRFGTDTDDDRALAPFAHEASLLNDLSHGNVAKIIGFIEDVRNGVAWLVFAWEKNGNLREFIRSESWELPERVSLIDDVAGGLSYLHGRSPPICHGDLKSLNILVNSENRAVISDFGSARAVDSEAERNSRGPHTVKWATRPHAADSLKAEVSVSGDFITMTGPAWTVRWAAPELLEGELPGLGSDIWAFGWICWEAVTGNFPFDKDNDAAVVRRIVTKDLPPISNNTQLKEIKVLLSLMEDCLRLDASERPPAMKCQQVVSLMDQAIPVRRGESNSATSHSSGLLNALGRIQLRNGAISQALEYFLQSLEVGKSVGDERGKATALSGLGDSHLIQSEYSKAEDLYLQARDIYSQIGSQLGFAHAVRNLGNVYYMRDEYSKAEESYLQASDIYSQIDNQLGFAQSVKGIGDVYRMRSEWSKAEKSYTQARDIFSQVGDQLGFAQSVKSLGDVYYMRDEYSKAEGMYIQARNIYSQIGHQLGFAQTVGGLGDVLRMRNKNSDAEEAYTQARDIFAQVGDHLGFARSVRSLGDMYRMRDEYSKAEESYIQARDIYSKIGDQLGFAQSVKSLGDVYHIRYEYSKAKDSYIQARDVHSQIGNHHGSAQSFGGMGRVQYAQGEYVEAEESFLQAQRIYRRIGDKLSSAHISWWLGRLHLSQAHYEAAEGMVREASAVYAELGLEQDVADCDELINEIRRAMEK